MVAPLLLSLLAVAITLGRAWRRRKEEEEDERISSEDWRADAWRRCLLPVMVIMFIAVPPAASFAFRAFECEDFTEGRAHTPTARYLRYDYSIECGPEGDPTAEYRTIVQWAVAAVVIYVVGVPLGHAALLFRARDSLRREQPVPFTRALEFLHKVHTPALPALPCLPTRPHACLPVCLPPLPVHQAYEPHVFWWELLEIGRKFALVAVAVTFGPGSVMQLVWGILVTVTFLCLRFEAQPYRSSAADHLAFSVDVFLVMVPRRPATCNPMCPARKPLGYGPTHHGRSASSSPPSP